MGCYGYENEMQGHGVKCIFDPWTCELQVRKIMSKWSLENVSKEEFTGYRSEHDEIVPLR